MSDPSDGEVHAFFAKLIVKHDRPVAGIVNSVVIAFLAFDFMLFDLALSSDPFIVIEILSLAVILKLYLVKVKNILTRIGYSPCDRVIKADDDAGCTRQRDPIYIDIGGMELYLIPDRRQAESEVRVIAKYRTARAGFFAAYCPVVTAQSGIRLGCQFDGYQ